MSLDSGATDHRHRTNPSSVRNHVPAPGPTYRTARVDRPDLATPPDHTTGLKHTSAYSRNHDQATHASNTVRTFRTDTTASPKTVGSPPKMTGDSHSRFIIPTQHSTNHNTQVDSIRPDILGLSIAVGMLGLALIGIIIYLCDLNGKFCFFRRYSQTRKQCSPATANGSIDSKEYSAAKEFNTENKPLSTSLYQADPFPKVQAPPPSYRFGK